VSDGTSYCTECGGGLRAGAKFCGGCGTPVVAEVSCGGCGTSNPVGQRFCDECGTPLAGRSTPAVGAPLVPPPRSNPAPTTAARPSVEGWSRVSIGHGRYRIEQFLGEGAAKQVYRAHDQVLDRPVAVSVVSMAGLDETGIERARREAQSMARLGANRHIVTVFDIGEERTDLFVVSELMTGGELAARLEAAPGRQLPVADAVRIGSQVADALHFVHERGIVHRDVKPQNIWVGADGVVKLGDFGLAVDRGRSRLTSHGMMIGTVAYMPPEQALGHDVDARAEGVEVGAVLYEMLCDAPPFESSDATAVISQHLSTAVTAPRVRRPDIPAQLDQLIVRLLAKDPAERPRSGAEVKASLDAIGAALSAGGSVNRSGAERLTEMGFVGRERELDALRGAVDDGLSSRGRIIVVGGDDGVGKTRVVSEAASYATLRGAKVVWGRCVEDPGAPAYWPWVQVIRSLVHDQDDVELVADLGPGAVEIAQIVPDLRARVPEAHEARELEPEQARFRLFDSVSTYLLNAARRQPIVIVLDDLHAADPSSLRLLEFLAGHVGTARLLVMGTARDSDLAEADPLARSLAALGRERSFDRIRLGGLDLGDVHQLFEHAMGRSAGGRSELALVEAVHAESEGNPFFAEEIIRHLSASGRVHKRDDGRWRTEVTDLREVGTPEGIRDAIMRRVDVLSDACRDLLATATVFGRTFDIESLGIVAGVEEPDVQRLLREATAAGVLTATGDDHKLRFEHAALRDTLYEQLAAERRHDLHRRAGEAIEELRDDDLEPHLGEIAHHFVQAAADGSDEETAAKAGDYAWWAGERAVQQHAYEEAAVRFEQALTLLPDGADQAPRRCELLLALGDAQWRTGELARARDSFLEAAKIARRAALDDAFARAALGYGGGVGGVGLTDRADETLVRLLREGLERVPERDSILRVQLQGRLAVELVHSDASRDERIALADDTIRMADRIGEPRNRLIALYSRQWADVGPDDVRGQMARADDILRLATAVEDREMQFRARLFRYGALLQLGDAAAAARELAALEQLADELRQPYFEWQVGVLRGGWKLKSGSLAEAEGIIAETANLGRLGNEELTANSFAAQMFMLVWARDGVDQFVDGIVTRAQRYDQSAWPIAAALIFAEAGRGDEARSRLHALAADDFSAVRFDRNWLTAMTLLAMTAARLEEAEVAAAIYDRLAPYADQHTVLLGGAAFFGSTHFFAGLAARTAGRLDLAIDHFLAARQANDRVDEHIVTPRLCGELAMALLDRGRHGEAERAREEIEHGLAVARAGGMQRHVEDLLKLRLETEGVDAPVSAEGSIFLVARSVRSNPPDLSAAAAPDGTVTILFSDIQDSTVLTDRLGDRRWMELLRDHNAIVTAALSAHGGFEVKAQGDGYMLAFDSARRGLRCAIDIQRELARYRSAHPANPLHVRVGLHTGEVIRDQDDFFGRNVILAARIAGSAAGDEILVSSVLRELVISSGDIEFGDSREIELKGLSGLHRVYTVPW